MKKVQLFTDGACSGNPGPGGYGTILRYGTHEKILSQGYILTTNNRMELLAIIIGLESLKEPCEVDLYSDSKYIIDAITKGWALKWRQKNWKRNKKDKAKNPDMWDRLLNLLEQHQVNCHWVRGHTGHAENERCDSLAVNAAASTSLLEDKGYEGS